MNLKHKIYSLLAIFMIAGGFVYGQKGIEKSRLNVGQNVKKVNFSINQVSPLLKNNLPKQLNISSKATYTQFYRDLLIAKSSSASVDNNDKNNKVDKIVLSNIYPNPANDFVMLDYKVNGNYNNATITFYNLIGKEISDYDLSSNQDRLKVNTSNWESGIYMYQLVVDDKKIVTKKLVVRHN